MQEGMSFLLAPPQLLSSLAMRYNWQPIPPNVCSQPIAIRSIDRALRKIKDILGSKSDSNESKREFHLEGVLDLIYAQAPAVVCVKGLEGLLVGGLLFQSIEVYCCRYELLIVNGSCIRLSYSRILLSVWRVH